MLNDRQVRILMRVAQGLPAFVCFEADVRDGGNRRKDIEMLQRRGFLVRGPKVTSTGRQILETVPREQAISLMSAPWWKFATPKKVRKRRKLLSY